MGEIGNMTNICPSLSVRTTVVLISHELSPHDQLMDVDDRWDVLTLT